MSASTSQCMSSSASFLVIGSSTPCCFLSYCVLQFIPPSIDVLLINSIFDAFVLFLPETGTAVGAANSVQVGVPTVELSVCCVCVSCAEQFANLTSLVKLPTLALETSVMQDIMDSFTNVMSYGAQVNTTLDIATRRPHIHAFAVSCYHHVYLPCNDVILDVTHESIASLITPKLWEAVTVNGVSIQQVLEHGCATRASRHTELSVFAKPCCPSLSLHLGHLPLDVVHCCSTPCCRC